MDILDSNSLARHSTLQDSDKNLLAVGYAKSDYSEPAKKILATLWMEGNYLECDCQPISDNPPILGVRKLTEEKYILANLPNRDPHSETCLFAYKHQDNKHQDKEYEPVVHENELGYLSVSHSGIKEIYKTLIHNSGLNIISPQTWHPDLIEGHLIDGARLSHSMAKKQIAKRVHYGYQSLKRAEEILKDNPHGDYQICFNLISDFDNRSFNLSFNKEKPYWHDAGVIYNDCHTNKGPFIATSVIAKHKSSIIALASHIQPVLSRWMPLPIYSHDHREVAFELVGETGLFTLPKYQVMKCSLLLNQYPISTINGDTIFPDFIIKSKSGDCLLGHPKKDQRNLYSHIGKLIWFRELSRNQVKRRTEIKAILKAIEEHIKPTDTAHRQ